MKEEFAAQASLPVVLACQLGLEPGGVAMVHCRMSALGCVVGGAETVVRALLDALGPDGTLMAYTGWQDAPPDDLDARRLVEHAAGWIERNFASGELDRP
jgi:aminoglycoside N3'-acetyltransferase